MARLKVKYTEEVAPALFKKFGYKSTMQIPKIEKVVLNVGCGEARENPKVLDAVVSQLSQITGQKAIITIAKKSVGSVPITLASNVRPSLSFTRRRVASSTTWLLVTM